MAKIYTTLLAAGALLLSGVGTVGAALGSSPEVQAESDSDTTLPPLQPYAPDLNLEFVIVDNQGLVTGSITAPEKLLGDWETGREDEGITGTMDIKLVKSCNELNVTDEFVEEWKEVSPNEEITFEDKELIIGKRWEYRAIAIVDGVESPSYGGINGAYIGIQPEEVTDFTLSADKGSAPVTLTLTVPNKVKDADKFQGITYQPARVYVMREFRAIGSYDNINAEEIWQQESPKTDTPITFEDDNNGAAMPEGTYYYTAYVEWEWGTSRPNTQNIGLFEGAPSTPKDISLSIVEEGVLVSWTPVVEADYNGGYLDPESVVYDVYRYFGIDENYNDITELIAESLISTECLDNLEGINQQMNLKYQVIARNKIGSSNPIISQGVIVGPPCPLPFTETFGTSDPTSWPPIKPDMLWEAASIDTDASWQTGSYATYYDANWNTFYIYPSDPSKGLVYTNFASYQPTGEVTFTSGDINFQSYDKGTVTFRYYGHPDGTVKLYVDVMRYDNPIEPQEGTETQAFETVWEGSIFAEEEGWIEKAVEFSGFEGSDKISLRLRAVSDEIPEDGIFVPACIEYVKVEGDETGDVDMLNSDVISVEYYDMKGMRLAAPVKGQPIIRRSVMSDGSIRTSKVILK